MRRVEVGQVELVVLADREVAQLDAALLGQHQPGHEVGVVLDLGEQDRLALGEEVAAVGVGDEVERLGGVLREDDLASPGAARR